jgi:DNA-binding transcriptional MerR regulator
MSSVGSFTIDRLANLVASTLTGESVKNANGRVRAVPDVRTLRYYTTLGLLDRPTHLEGRTAYYSRRHVLQLVAIKRLQAQGLKLAQVQAALLGASDADLERLAQLPADFDLQSTTAGDQAAGADSKSKREPARVFWKARPTATSTVSNVDKAQAESTQQEQSAAVLLGIPLDAATSLLVQAVRPLDEQDLDALRQAAQPLLQTLQARRLI